MPEKKLRFLISYDISDTRRLRKIHKVVSSHAIRVQYSLYLFHGNRHEMQTLVEQIQRISDHQEDDIRTYRIPPGCRPEIMGKSFLSRDILLIGEETEGFTDFPGRSG
ncbi:CRISPR-associated endonuclease Cas2 [Thiolapillus sp.]